MTKVAPQAKATAAARNSAGGEAWNSVDQGKRKTGTPWVVVASADNNKRKNNAKRTRWAMHPIVTAPGVSDGSNRSRFPIFFAPCTHRCGNTLKQNSPALR